LVIWAAPRFPAAADGTFYHRLASRLATGAGYTWLWDDGAVTPAAHYPVGYPALLAGPYALFGASTTVAMAVAGVLGTISAVCTYRVAAREMRGRAPLLAGLLVALHPALLPYTAALMTEGVTASLLAIVLACRERRGGTSKGARLGLALAASALGGLLVLVRPQNLLLLPVLALATSPPGARWKHRLLRAAVGPLLALAFVAPWTARNCREMHRCALVSVNGGWNLLIGAHATSGGWSPVPVPEACKEVWDEAGKDLCFETAAKKDIAAHPGSFLALVPRKLANTFEYVGAAGWYLHTSNPEAFTERAKNILGTAETVFLRCVLALALFVQARRWGNGKRPLRKWAVVVAGLAVASATIGCLALAALAVRRRATPLEMTTAAAVLSTAAVHAVFFGAGRYALVVLPFVAVLAARIKSPGRPAPSSASPSAESAASSSAPAEPAS
jgi:4-amino-4-deoxy-L-arabinose transferase-like glycosyltransferase